MIKKTKRVIITVAMMTLPAIITSFSGQTQQPGIKRTDLQQHDLSIPGQEAVQVRVDFPPGSVAGKHTHPGEEIIYVIEGILEYQLEDRPPIRLKAGQVLFIPAGVIHAAKNLSDKNAAELATYIVKKGKPLVTKIP